MIKKLSSVFLIACVLFVPWLAGAATAEPAKDGYFVIVKCTGPDNAKIGEPSCTFKDFMAQIDKIINLLLYVAVLLATISFVYAGFRLIFSGGNEDALSHAKHIFWNVLIGLVLAYGAWIIVHFIVTSLGVKEGYTLLK